MHPFLHPALRYEVLLKESRPVNEQGSPHRHHGSKATPTGPSQERIDTCFQVLGNILSHCLHNAIDPSYMQMTFWCTLVFTKE